VEAAQWSEFYYAINNNAVAEERWSVKDIFSVYLNTCGQVTPGITLGCNWDYISWTGAPAVGTVPAHKSLTAGVNATFGADSTKALAFIRDGNGYGVSNQL